MTRTASLPRPITARRRHRERNTNRSRINWIEGIDGLCRRNMREIKKHTFRGVCFCQHTGIPFGNAGLVPNPRGYPDRRSSWLFRRGGITVAGQRGIFTLLPPISPSIYIRTSTTPQRSSIRSSCQDNIGEKSSCQRQPNAYNSAFNHSMRAHGNLHIRLRPA